MIIDSKLESQPRNKRDLQAQDANINGNNGIVVNWSIPPSPRYSRQNSRG